MTATLESDLASLRRRAEDMAKGRGERATTGHLLAAIASEAGSASELLRERRLDADVLLKAARVLVDDHTDAVPRAVQRARELASRSPSREPGAIHLLFALCQERATAAYRAIAQCGSDVVKLRTAAMQLALGVVAPRRLSTGAQLALPPPNAASSVRPSPSPPHGPRISPRSTNASELRLTGKPSTSPGPALHAPRSRPNTDDRLEPHIAPSTPSAPGASVSSSPSGQNPRPANGSPSQPPPAPLPRAHPPPSLAPPLPGRARRGRNGSPTGVVAGASFARFELDAKQTPLLAALGRNLTLAARRGELDPVLGREEEIERTLDVLAKRHANCPCLVGPAGVGKTSIVRGLAQRLANAPLHGTQDERIVVEIDAASLVAGTGVRGALAERLAQLRAEVGRVERGVILFFDELHVILTADDEASAELKVSLGRGELACIGATTPEDYKRVVAADAALARRLTAIEVPELAPDEALVALERVAPAFERHHGVHFTPEAIAAAVTWSARYVPERALPDKAVSVLDLAGARSKRRGDREVGREQIAHVISESSGVPVERLLETDGARMLRIEQMMTERIVGHADAIARMARVLRRNASGFRSRRPIGSFLLLGPTGVGKTETAKALAEFLFDSPHAMTRVDLSEYAEAHAIARLVGAPPGYVGHEAGGQLTEAARKRPYQVLLLDEIEKAHKDVLEAFLQVFDDGRMTDGRGRVVDFTNVVVVMTSNLGGDVARPAARPRIGFGARGGAASTRPDDRDVRAYEEAVCGAARAALAPEFYNRIDEVIAFAPLGRADVAEVARRMLRALGIDLERARGVRLDATDDAIAALLDQGGFDPELGARPMRRAIARLVEAPIAEMLLKGDLQSGDVALVEAKDGHVVIDRTRPSGRLLVG